MEPRMASKCADLLDESAKNKASGDEHLAAARRLLDTDELKSPHFTKNQ